MGPTIKNYNSTLLSPNFWSWWFQKEWLNIAFDKFNGRLYRNDFKWKELRLFWTNVYIEYTTWTGPYYVFDYICDDRRLIVFFETCETYEC